LVIVIAIGVLLVLARFRFPQPDAAPATAVTSPLERLAARATFDDLSAAVQGAFQRASSSVVLVDVAPEPPPMLPAPSRQGQPAEVLVAGPVRRVAGIRVRDDRVIALLPPGYRPAAGIDPESPDQARANVDPVRGVAVWLIAAASSGERSMSPVTDFSGFAYVAVVEAASGGPTVTPLFIGRVDPVPDDRWSGAVWRIGGSAAPQTGSLVFLLDGRFLGLVIDHADQADHAIGGRSLVPASLVAQAIDSIVGPPGTVR
jgi:hypothetical protein